jgi:hypothetical protein
MQKLLAVTGFAAVAAAGTVSVPLSKHTKHNPRDDLSSVVRRDDSFDVSVLNNITGKGYYIDLGIGTPPQKLSFLVDTGSSDTWVNSVEAEFCTEGQTILYQQFAPSCMPQFDSDESKTFEVVSRDFEIAYLDGSSAAGVYFNDTVTIDGDDAVLENQQLGLATDTSHPTGIMGLGMKVAVAARKVYPTIIDNLVSQGFIDTPAFSVYLDSLSEDSGTILFGGIDTKKYVGSLTTLPLKPDTLSDFDNITSYSVDLKGFSVDGGIDTPDLSTSAIFDTGSTLTLLPENVVQPIYDKLDVKTIADIPTPFIDCKYAQDEYNKYKFNFKFDGVTITVPLRELVVDSLGELQETLKENYFFKDSFKDFGEICLFGIVDGGGYVVDDAPKYALLGDTFLRSAYVVYDLANQQLAVAPAYTKSEESNIVTLKANSSLPKIKGMDGTSTFYPVYPITETKR